MGGEERDEMEDNLPDGFDVPIVVVDANRIQAQVRLQAKKRRRQGSCSSRQWGWTYAASS